MYDDDFEGNGSFTLMFLLFFFFSQVIISKIEKIIIEDFVNF